MKYSYVIKSQELRSPLLFETTEEETIVLYAPNTLTPIEEETIYHNGYTEETRYNSNRPIVFNHHIWPIEEFRKVCNNWYKLFLKRIDEGMINLYY